MSRARLLFTGATGLLAASALARLARDFEVVPVGGRSAPAGGARVELCDAAAVARLVERLRPEVVVHAAAMTSVEGCEREPGRAWRTNVVGTRNLAAALGAQTPTAKLVFVSTDQVYDGAGPHPEDRPAPGNVYALTKLWAEDVARTLPGALVVRTNFFALDPGRGRGFAEWLIGSLAERRPITLFDDVLFNPLFAGDLADLVALAITRGLAGTYNLGAGGGGLSKADFAHALAGRLGLSLAAARTGPVAEAGFRARRPTDMRMAVAAAERALGLPMPDVAQGLDRLAAAWQGAAERRVHAP